MRKIAVQRYNIFSNQQAFERFFLCFFLKKCIKKMHPFRQNLVISGIMAPTKAQVKLTALQREGNCHREIDPLFWGFSLSIMG